MKTTEYRILRDKDRTLGLTLKDFDLEDGVYLLKEEVAKKYGYFAKYDIGMVEGTKHIDIFLQCVNRSMYDSVHPVQEHEKEYI